MHGLFREVKMSIGSQNGQYQSEWLRLVKWAYNRGVCDLIYQKQIQNPYKG